MALDDCLHLVADREAAPVDIAHERGTLTRARVVVGILYKLGNRTGFLIPSRDSDEDRDTLSTSTIVAGGCCSYRTLDLGNVSLLVSHERKCCQSTPLTLSVPSTSCVGGDCP